MSEQRPLSPMEQIRRAYEETEKKTSQTMEEVVSSQGFAEMLSMLVGNAMSASRISGNVLDDIIRRTHIAGRTDLAGVGRQIGRTEDKLELVLQRIEALEGEVRGLRAELTERPSSAARRAASEEQSGDAPRARRRPPRAATKATAGPPAAVAAVAPQTSITASAPSPTESTRRASRTGEGA
ncbi:MAG: hypothetical protein ABI746_01730 [Dermatophilaceae bacterium]